jgi:hypothetical protein
VLGLRFDLRKALTSGLLGGVIEPAESTRGALIGAEGFEILDIGIPCSNAAVFSRRNARRERVSQRRFAAAKKL